jgi:hypothetical protein
MDWPVEGAALYRNFGWNEGGRPLLGAIFEGEGPVFTSEEGELLYRRRLGDKASRLPAPLGSWIAVDHEDGIVSIYGRLEDQPHAQIPPVLRKDYPLASMGQSGYAEKRGVYFSLFDRRERRWVNPAMIVPPLEDTRPPLIQIVRLRNASGLLIDPAVTRTISQGRYTVTVGAVDTLNLPEEYPLAPHRLICSVNGGEIGTLSFETCSARNGTLLVNRNGPVPAREVYAPFPGFEVGELWLTRGQAALELIAQDMAGNTRSVVFRLQVE